MEKNEELKKHGNASFPCSVYEYSAPIENKEKIYCHWHKEVELLYIISGNCLLKINHQSYFVQAGDFVFIPVNQVHMAIGDQEHAFQFIALVFHPDFISSFGNDYIQQTVIDPMVHWKYETSPVMKHDAFLADIMHHILSVWQKHEVGYALDIKTQVFLVLNHIYAKVSQENMVQISAVDYKVTEIKKMISFIQKNYMKNLTLASTASFFSISKGHLCRFFKEMTGMSFVEYVNYYRINESCELLKKTNYSISVISEMTGFHTVSYFNRTFQKYMHKTPKEYRRNL